ncbi:cell division protein PerM [Actinacidiphila soli]|uniref:cell division protein PerM n=1 Tax=Actinacidiphila soli TaxID=2487275 RepID=UPI001F0C231A|nr:DUF6350 family protein [Actinacidiphila soli]
MTDRNDRTPSLPSLPERAPSSLAGGVAAAGLGLGATAVLVLFLWIISPYPDSGGIQGTLHVAADVWLLAHGTGLVRMETLGGAPAPAGMTPLLLAALPAWLLYRAGADSAADEGEVGWAALGWLVGGYTAVGGCAVLYTSYGPVRSDALGALLHLPVFALLAAATGAWFERGRPPIPLPGAVPREGAVGTLRAAAAGLAVLLGGGALLTAVSLVWHVGASAGAFGELSDSVSGMFTVLLVSIALVPNAAVWGAAYALGPGFSIGAGSIVAPAGASGYPVLPAFPLLTALPEQGGGTPVTWAVLAIPAGAGLAVAHFAVGRTTRGTAAVTACAAGLCGLVVMGLAAVAAGPLGEGTLADFGPSACWAGAAACAWTLVVGLPVALVLRWWRLRDSEPAAPTGAVELPAEQPPGLPEPEASETAALMDFPSVPPGRHRAGDPRE